MDLGRRIRRHVAVAVWLTILVGGVVASTEPLFSHKSMRIVAHRGDLGTGPENSLVAIRAALASDADGIEFDVNRSADGTWWLLHDETLEDRTTGTGRMDATSDRELASLRMDGGLGFRRDRDADLGLARLDEVLPLLAGYDGLVIVDCKDRRVAGHEALASYLAERGLFTGIIARDLQGASAIKRVDSRFTTYTLGDLNWHPDVDVWLAWSEMDVHPPLTVWADLWGDLAMFVEQGYHGRAEEPLLDNGRRWGVGLVITNDVSAALTWRRDVAKVKD
jgi:glycerophosphoryl diester phosphodiesterase